MDREDEQPNSNVDMPSSNIIYQGGMFYNSDTPILRYPPLYDVNRFLNPTSFITPNIINMPMVPIIETPTSIADLTSTQSILNPEAEPFIPPNEPIDDINLEPYEVSEYSENEITSDSEMPDLVDDLED